MPVIWLSLFDARVILGRELVQRRVDQADGDGLAVHGLEDADEVVALERQQLGQRLLAGFERVGDDHLLDGQAAFFGVEEHVLGAAQADAFGAHLDRRSRRRRACRRWCGP